MTYEELKPIKYRIFLLPERNTIYHEATTDFRIVCADKIPIPIIFDLKFEEIVEEVPISGKIKFEYCCVEERKVTIEDNEPIINIYGRLC